MAVHQDTTSSISFFNRIIRRIKWEIYLRKVSDASGLKIRKKFNNTLHLKNGLTIDVSSSLITNRTVASIHHGSYEQDELLLIAKYWQAQLPTIEMGSSIGITGITIASQSSQTLYAVEANPMLIPIIEEQFRRNKLTNYHLYNRAVSTSSTPVYFTRGGATDTGRISDQQHTGDEVVPPISLAAIIAEKQLQQYNLICDIEGSEVDFILNEQEALQQCKVMIIELHDVDFKGKRYRIIDLVNLLVQQGFELVEQANEVYCFTR